MGERGCARRLGGCAPSRLGVFSAVLRIGDAPRVLRFSTPRLAAGWRQAAAGGRNWRQNAERCRVKERDPPLASLVAHAPHGGCSRPQAAAWRQNAERCRANERDPLRAARRSRPSGGSRRPRGGGLFPSPRPLGESPVLAGNVQVFVACAPQAAAGGRVAAGFSRQNLVEIGLG